MRNGANLPLRFYCLTVSVYSPILLKHNDNCIFHLLFY